MFVFNLQSTVIIIIIRWLLLAGIVNILLNCCKSDQLLAINTKKTYSQSVLFRIYHHEPEYEAQLKHFINSISV